MLVYSLHARERMLERRISEREVEEAVANVDSETPARTGVRVNLWGRTDAGRRLRITTYRDMRTYVITVVALEEG